MPSLIVPAGVAHARRAQIAQQQSRGHGLGKMLHTIDPAQKIYDQIGMKTPGKLPGFHLNGNRVLVGVYERPDKLASGIELSDLTLKEDQFQGKAALVLMKGHSAFVSDDHFDFGPDAVEPGEWVAIHVSDGRKIIINGQLCRVIRDQDIVVKIPSPDSVY